MLKTFIQSFRLRNAYKVNTIIYSIKQLPVIKKILPESLYQNRALKVIGNIISILMEVISVFIGKLIYIATMIYGGTLLYESNQADIFVHLFLFLTIVGTLLNTYMFNPTKDKYYAMFIMRMDAKKYTLSNYAYSIIKVIIGFMPFTFLFGLMCNVNWVICLLIPFFVASAKILVGAYYLYEYKKKGITINENKPIKYIWVIIGISLLLAYGLPYIHIVIPQIIFSIIAVITILLGIGGIVYIRKFEQYREMYKIILTDNNMNAVKDANQITKDNVLKQIEIDEKLVSNKKGYAYFNDLFIKRHSKILSKATKKIAMVCLLIIIAMLIAVNMNEEFKIKTNEVIMNYLPYFVFIMYLINRGQTVTQAMFMNCDHSMLTYSFYRNPISIVKLFKERIKSVVLINLLPAVVIGVGLPLLLYATGGTDSVYNYIILFTSIIAMSIFFSVHHLVLYYLLQPYNVASETKSSTYSVASFLTYVVCYYMIKVQLPTTYFGIATIIFAVLYCVISLFLAYRLAPKTFKLRI